MGATSTVRPEYDPLADDLSIERRAAQLVIPVLDLRSGSKLDEVWDQARKSLDGLGVGGFILFGGDEQGLRKRLDDLKGRPGPAGIAPFIAADLERGLGQQVAGGTELPPAMALGASGDEALARAAGALVAREARAVGIDWIYAPVLDLADRADNPIVGARAFGADPELASRLGAAFVRGVEEAGAMACAKHFPGHGGTALDSHDSLPVVDRSREGLEARDLAPFRAAVSAGVSSIMTAHVAFPALADGRKTPATIERAIVDGLLRRRLKYDGLVVTDALIMSGLTNATGGDETRAAIAALEAGCDMILYPRDPRAVVLAIAAWARTGGQEARARLIDAVGRVLHAKRRLGLAGPSRQRTTARLGSPSDSEATALSQRIARAAVTRVGRVQPPLDRKTRVLIVAIDDDGRADALLDFVGEIEAALEDVRVVRLGPDATSDERGRALSLAAVDRVIVAVSCRVRAWKGRAGLGAAHRESIRALGRLGRPLTVVALCGPHALARAIPNDAEMLLAYGDDAHCQRAAVAVLLGGEASARAPATLELFDEDRAAPAESSAPSPRRDDRGGEGTATPKQKA